MTEKNKDLYDFLKVKLDFYKSFLTGLLVAVFGLVGFLALNFTKNSVTLNFLAVGAIILLLVAFVFMASEVAQIFKRMKGLI
jgi:hypothetical protein